MLRVITLILWYGFYLFKSSLKSSSTFEIWRCLLFSVGDIYVQDYKYANDLLPKKFDDMFSQIRDS